MFTKKPLTHSEFLCDMEMFCVTFGVSERELGRASVNDTALVLRVRSGKSPTLSRVEQVYQFMIDHANLAAAEKSIKANNRSSKN